jgi:SAM-dependent methyltransferase
MKLDHRPDIQSYPAGIDWDKIWNNVNGANIKCGAYGECASIWNSKEQARAFLENSIENPGRVHHIIESLPLSPDYKVLDIGSGPGTIAVPIADRVGHVTAVEPSPGMADVMAEYAAASGAKNLKIVNKRWEDIDVPADLEGPYDLVVASYSLGMQDLSKSIEMMCDVSSKWVYIFWISGMPSWEIGLVDLWPKLHGKDFDCSPQADIIYNILYSMGIYPNMRVSRLQNQNRFPDLDFAVSQYSSVYNIRNSEQEEILRGYLNQNLVKTEDGYELSETNRCTAIWWDVGQ